MYKNDKFKFLNIFLGVLIAVDILIWITILWPSDFLAGGLEMYFLDVGQGDSSFIRLEGGVDVLIDGGPINGRLENNLERILPAHDRYIDLVMISHPQLDHFGGIVEVLKNYNVGAVLTSGQKSQSAAWQELERVLVEKKIPHIALSADDVVEYGDSGFDILWPRKDSWSADVNDSSLVVLFEHSYVLPPSHKATGGQDKNVRMKALFAGDIDADIEKRLVDLYDINIDVLKVNHHGSKFSSDLEFLKEASPAISIIEVGKNSYGHPTKQVLSRLANVGSQIYRTDLDGLVKLVVDDGRIMVYR